ncbi:efflux RND transporter permease subunit [Borreliella americana]|uniref:efflux RND transporter permease subunit n=1 Tax=Borreliella americana TaxID=478807 RepID=UPI001E3EA5D6|nr:RND family transporter [Borreliella americana]MCD2349445.1 RND family transporter [Borreliella americana]MCD2381780.1 RND family transporter [Borreliella americana]
MDFEGLSIKHKGTIFTIFILITIFLGFFLKNLKFDANILKLIPKTKETESLIDIDKSNSLLSTIVIFQDKKNIFNKKNFETINSVINEITKILKVSPNAVTSIFSYFPQFKKEIYTDKDIEEIKNKIKSTPFVKNTFLGNSENLIYFIIIPSESDQINFSRNLKTELDEMEKTIKKYETDDLKLYLTGDLIVREKILNYMVEDFKILGPLATFVVIILLYLIIKNLIGALIPIFIALLSLIWTFGIKGLVQSPITVPETSMIVLLISIGCANAVHIINEIFKLIKKEQLSKESIKATIKKLKTPILLTSLTTAFGFLSLTTSSINAYKTMGIFMSIGVIISMIISLTVLPGIITLIPFTKKRSFEKENKANKIFFLEKLAKLNTQITKSILKRKYTSSIMVLIILGISVVGLLKIEINFDEKDYFKESTSVKKTLNLMQKEMGGISIFKIEIEGNPGEFKNAKAMQTLDLITDKLDAFSTKTQSSSINGILKFTNFKIKKESPLEYKLPENKIILNKLINLVDRGDWTKENKKMYINDDWSLISIIVRIEDNSTEGIKKFEKYAIKTINEYMRNNKYHFSGVYDKVLIAKTMVKEQVMNIITTLGSITLLLMFFFKSIKTGIIIAIPVAWSVFLNFAIMRLFGITLNPATATIASVSMGVGVDYSIHFFNTFILQYKKNQIYKTALLESIPSVFNGIFANSISVGIGFLTLTFSSYKIISTLGAIIAFTMLTTSLASLTLLPLLIHLFKPRVKLVSNNNVKKLKQ